MIMTATRVNGVMFLPALALIGWDAASTGRERRAAVAAALAGAAGIAGYSLFVYSVSGNPFEWYDSITRWGYHPGGNPLSGLASIGLQLISRPIEFIATEPMAPYATLNAMAAAGALLAVPFIWDRFGRGYAAIVVLGLAAPAVVRTVRGFGPLLFRALSPPDPVRLDARRNPTPRIDDGVRAVLHAGARAVRQRASAVLVIHRTAEPGRILDSIQREIDRLRARGGTCLSSRSSSSRCSHKPRFPTSPANGRWSRLAAAHRCKRPPVTEMVFLIEQKPDQIAIESTTGSDKPISVVYPLVPAPKPPADPMGAGLKRAYWDGRRLVIEQGGTISGQTVSLRQSLTMDSESGELIVERLVIVQHGYSQRGAQNYSTVKDVFARAQR
jgi:hypothetical protein